MSASCPRQKVHSSLQFPSLFFSSLESFSVLFWQAKLDECVAIIVICINSPPTQIIDGTSSKFANAQCDTTNLAISFYVCFTLVLDVITT